MDLKILTDALPTGSSSNLLVGFDSSDDAAVYQVGNDLAIVQTVDFITPMTDDPYLFGQLSAANALSDIYAMGAKPVTALNLCNFPEKGIPMDVLRLILEGGSSKIEEAGAVLVGGHTIKDNELKYGLSVTGLVNPEMVVTNAGAKIGDALVLTKPLGTGILYNGTKNGDLDSKFLDAAVRNNAILNKSASEAMLRHGVNACTDVTGFGLLGHLKEMMQASGTGAVVNVHDMPVYEMTYETVAKGFKPGMSKANLESIIDCVDFEASVSEEDKWLLVDPQTSGGLLISLPADKADDLLLDLHSGDALHATLIGEVVESDKTGIIVKK